MYRENDCVHWFNSRHETTTRQESPPSLHLKSTRKKPPTTIQLYQGFGIWNVSVDRIICCVMFSNPSLRGSLQHFTTGYYFIRRWEEDDKQDNWKHVWFLLFLKGHKRRRRGRIFAGASECVKSIWVTDASSHFSGDDPQPRVLGNRKSNQGLLKIWWEMSGKSRGRLWCVEVGSR